MHNNVPKMALSVPRRLQDYIDRLVELAICLYCGGPGTIQEHFYPDSRGGDWIVPACYECNALAGSREFRSIAAKRRYVQFKLFRQYAERMQYQSSQPSKLRYQATRNRSWIWRRIEWRNPALDPKLEDANIVEGSLLSLDLGEDFALDLVTESTYIEDFEKNISSLKLRNLYDPRRWAAMDARMMKAEDQP